MQNYKSTDENKLDSYLKENLVRDLSFRMAILGAITCLAIKHAQVANKSSLQILESYLEKTAPLLNTFGTCALFVAAIGIALKDYQHITGSKWPSGYAGGVFRRLGGDGTLWIIGAIASALFMFIYVTATEARSTGDYFIGVFSIAFLSVMLALTSIFNVLVRRGKPTPLALPPDGNKPLLTSKSRFFLMYGLLAVGGLVNIKFDLVVRLSQLINHAFL